MKIFLKHEKNDYQLQFHGWLICNNFFWECIMQNYNCPREIIALELPIGIIKGFNYLITQL